MVIGTLRRFISPRHQATDSYGPTGIPVENALEERMLSGKITSVNALVKAVTAQTLKVLNAPVPGLQDVDGREEENLHLVSIIGSSGLLAPSGS